MSDFKGGTSAVIKSDRLPLPGCVESHHTAALGDLAMAGATGFAIALTLGVLVWAAVWSLTPDHNTHPEDF